MIFLFDFACCKKESLKSHGNRIVCAVMRNMKLLIVSGNSETGLNESLSNHRKYFYFVEVLIGQIKYACTCICMYKIGMYAMLLITLLRMNNSLNYP